VSHSLARTVAVYAAGLAVFSLATAVGRRGLGRPHAGAAVVLGVAAVLDALIAVVGIIAGARPAEPMPFAGYLLLSTIVVPAGWRYARGSARGWDTATFALATAALFVICVRLGRTWG
jgi:hypothetical protein